MAIHKQSAGHVQATLDVGDLEIGAVELKNATTDERAEIGVATTIVESDIAVAMQAPVLGITTDAAVITDAAGTISAKLRGLIRWAFERMPAALGQGTMAQSLPVVLPSDQASIPVAATTTIADGADIALGTTTDATASSTVAEDATARTGIALWKGIKNILILINGKFAALGEAAMAASMPVVIANDQTDVPVTLDGETVAETPVVAAAGDVHEPAVNTAAIVTYGATADVNHVITGVAWSYHGGIPANGNLLVEDVAGTTVFSVDIHEEGPGGYIFPKPKKAAAANTAMIITLAAGGAGITGKVSVLNHWTEV